MSYRRAILVAFLQTWLALPVSEYWFGIADRIGLLRAIGIVALVVLLPILVIPPIARWSEPSATLLDVHRRACWIVIGVSAMPLLLTLAWLPFLLPMFPLQWGR